MMQFQPESAWNLSQDRRTLAATGWLSSRNVEFRKALLRNAQVRQFASGETLYHYGDTADGLFGVVEGALTVSIPADDGQEFIAHRDGTGFWIGDLAMLSDQTRLVTVVAAQATRTLFVPAWHILEMVAETPDFYRDFYALTHDNMQLALRIMANLAVARTDQRLALRLLHLSETAADPDGWMTFSQEDLSTMVAVSLPTVQRILRRMSEEGIVELGYSRLRIINRADAVALCQG